MFYSFGRVSNTSYFTRKYIVATFRVLRTSFEKYVLYRLYCALRHTITATARVSTYTQHLTYCLCGKRVITNTPRCIRTAIRVIFFLLFFFLIGKLNYENLQTPAHLSRLGFIHTHVYIYAYTIYDSCIIYRIPVISPFKCYARI